MQRPVVRLCGENQLLNGFHQPSRCPARCQTTRCEICTAFLVVTSTRIVNRIVKPNGEFDGIRLDGKMSNPVKLVQAIGDVLLVVIMPVRFGIHREEMVVKSAGCVAMGCGSP